VYYILIEILLIYEISDCSLFIVVFLPWNAVQMWSILSQFVFKQADSQINFLPLCNLSL